MLNTTKLVNIACKSRQVELNHKKDGQNNFNYHINFREASLHHRHQKEVEMDLIDSLRTRIYHQYINIVKLETLFTRELEDLNLWPLKSSGKTMD